MPRYELTGTSHEGPGQSQGAQKFKRGDVIETGEPLDVLFPNRFRRLDNPNPPKAEATPIVMTPAGDRPPIPAKPAVELAKVFDQQEAALPPDVKKEDQPEPVDPGQDVTSKFRKAKDAGLVVFEQEDGSFNIAKEKDPSKLLNDGPLTKADVHKLITEHSKG